ncbi:MAG: threonine synthase [Clostridia bacterium]|nr:threonine synthase [Clostridia bacterium]MBQ4608112.1 threonine synthase [Clostridia bacterium]MBQ7052652.1 threonine synthase [Clostridia bacterium]
MQMLSTRGAAAVTPSMAILRGLAPDGGLYVPAEFPQFTIEEIAALAPLSYQERALCVLSRFLPDFTQDELKSAIAGAYGTGFDCEQIAPMEKVGAWAHALELWHGPTLAFKDMALQLLPYLLTMSGKKHGENREVFILVATSGDTGKAALEGFLDVPGTRCCVFYPDGGVSQAQRLQMVTTGGSNTHVIAVKGNFDDAQTGVKKIFSDPAFAAQMDAQGRVLSSANSINFGRLVPQVVYYFSAYADLIGEGAIQPGDKVNFCVPTGNFGDILAADYAGKAGLPVGRLICASNENNVLTDFIRTGAYDIRSRAFFRTISPSMDILISSNLERLLFDLCGNDGEKVAALMAQLKAEGAYQVDADVLEKLQAKYAAGYVDESGIRAEIARSWKEDGYLMDTHTAVASAVLREYMKTTGDQTVSVIVSTASPYKFGASVLEAIAGGEAVSGRDDFACCAMLSELTKTREPDQIAGLPNMPVRHSAVCEKDAMAEAVLSAVK